METTNREIFNQRERIKLKQLDPLARNLHAEARKFFLRQKRIILPAMTRLVNELGLFRESIAPHDYLPILVSAFEITSESFSVAINNAVAGSFVLGAKSLTNLVIRSEADVPDAFLVSNEFAVEFLRMYGARRVTQINEATKDRMAILIANAVEEGISWDETAKRIEAMFDESFAGPPLWPNTIFRSRAVAVAVYETGNAYEQGNFKQAEMLEAAGLQMQKRWLTANDSKVRPEHAANQAKGWQPMMFVFQSGNKEINTLRPPTDPGCRCALLFRRRRGDISAAEKYTTIDEYIKELLNTPKDQRGADWFNKFDKLREARNKMWENGEMNRALFSSIYGIEP